MRARTRTCVCEAHARKCEQVFLPYKQVVVRFETSDADGQNELVKINYTALVDCEHISDGGLDSGTFKVCMHVHGHVQTSVWICAQGLDSPGVESEQWRHWCLQGHYLQGRLRI